jgi:tetratricopeptide (TPR) repeat protein
MSGPYVHHDPASALNWSLSGFLKCWLRTRHLALLIQGLPAIALGVVLGGLLISSGQPATSDTIDTYLTRAEGAIAQEDYEQAEFYFRKLQLLAPDNPAVIDKRAELAAGQGNYLEAVRLREALVRDGDRSNDARIHKWLASTALEQDLGLESPVDYARSHLDAVLAEKPGDPEAHYFFARLHMLQGDISNAIAHLEPIAAFDARFQLQLATLYLMRQPPDRVRALSNARSAASIFRKEIEQTQTSDVNTFHQLATAQVILSEYESAVQTLRQALTRFDQEATRKQLARAYVAWSDDVRRNAPDDLPRRMRLLEQALQTAPDEPAALHRLLEMASAEGDDAVQAETALRSALVDGVAPAAVHFSLGTLAAKRGDLEAAMRHLQQAEQLNPKTPVTLNNMAYIMAQMPEGDLNQALELANQAVKMAPRAAPFRETRGQILVRLERWSQAITDLEYANTRMHEPASRMAINRSLASAYRGLGDAATADAYQKKYEQLARQLQQHRPAAELGAEIDFGQLPADGAAPDAGGSGPPAASDGAGDDSAGNEAQRNNGAGIEQDLPLIDATPPGTAPPPDDAPSPNIDVTPRPRGGSAPPPALPPLP